MKMNYVADTDATKKELLKRLSDGQRVWGHVEHCSAMSRTIRLYVVNQREGEEARIMDISRLVCNLLSDRWSENHRGLVVAGTGFDAIFDRVRELSYALFGQHDSLMYDIL